MINFLWHYFFSISGYLFNSKSTARQFIIKKIKTLYIPFLGWNLIFLPIYWLTYYNGTFDWTYFLKTIFLIVTTNQRVPYYLGAICVIYFIIYVSKMIGRLKDNKVHRLLVFLGKNSMDILIWQFVSFKIVIAVQLLLEYGSVSRILEFYPTYIASDGWWVIYTIVGLFVPILWIRFLKSIFIGKLLKKIYVIN